jgi:hypothetical protein
VIKLGCKLMSEEHGTNDLVRTAARAEEVSIDFAAIFFSSQGTASTPSD